MPVQDFNINTRNAVAGQVYGLSRSNREIESWTLDFAAEFGAPVVRNGDRSATSTTGLTTNTPFYLDGITVRTVNHEQSTRPGDGSVAYSVDDVAGVLEEGKISVVAEEAVAYGGDVFIEEATGKWFGTDASGRSQVLNVRWESTTSAAKEIAIVRIEFNKILKA